MSPFQGYTIAPLIAAPAVTADDLVLLIRTDALLRAFALSGLRGVVGRIPGVTRTAFAHPRLSAVALTGLYEVVATLPFTRPYGAS